MNVLDGRARLLPLVVFLACAFLLYGRTLGYGFIQMDDDYLVEHNPIVAHITPSTVRAAFTTYDPELYIPLTFVSYQVDWQIGGGAPWSFHLTNILLHSLNAFLVFSVLILLGVSRRAAWIAGLLFVLHPLHTEAVSWISGRKDLLSTFFGLLSLLLYARFLREPRGVTYLQSLGAFMLGLLAKVSIAPLPVVSLLLAWRERRSLRRELLRQIPFLLVAAVSLAIGAYGKQSVIAQSTGLEWFGLVIKSLGFYLRMFVAPFGLSVVYPHTGWDTAAMAASIMSVGVLLGLTLWSLRRTRGFAVAVGCFLLLLAPTFLNYFKGGDTYFASDRYVYVPSIALFALLAVGVDRLLSRLPASRAAVVRTLGTALLVFYGAMSLFRAADWRSTETLFIDALHHYPDSQIAQTKIAAILINRGELDRAEQMLYASLAIRPTAKAYYNLGLIALQRERLPASLSFNLRALELDPNHDAAHVNAGYLLALGGDTAGAITHYEAAVRANPLDLDAKVSLASLLLRMGEKERALQIIDDILALDPHHPDVQTLLAQ